MDTLKSMQVFRAVVEQGSFTKAALHLHISIPSASKHLAHLENHVRAKLLHRNNRKQTLTQVGEKYYRECCHALDTLATARAEAQQSTLEPEGTLTITAPVWFANPFCSALFAEFRHQYPKIHLDLVLENQFTDLIAGGVDVALRVVNTPQENTIVKRLTQIPFSYVASPDYLKNHGIPNNEADLVEHLGIHPSYIDLNTPLPQTTLSNNTVMLCEMAKSGMGIAMLPDWLSTDAVSRGQLVNLFAFDEPVPLFATYMDRTFLSTKVRAFLDFMKKSLTETNEALTTNTAI